MKFNEIMATASEKNLFFDVDAKETLGQAAVIALCTDHEAERKTLGVAQVDGKLSDAINTAIARAAASYLKVSFEEDEKLSVPAAKAMHKEKEEKFLPDSALGVQEQPKKETAAPPIQEDAGFAEVFIDDGNSLQGFENFDGTSESFEAEVAKAASAAPAPETAPKQPQPTADETDDFPVKIGKHLARPMRASQICALILKGNEAEKAFLKQVSDMVKTARGNRNEVILNAEKFLEYAKDHGITV